MTELLRLFDAEMDRDLKIPEFRSGDLVRARVVEVIKTVEKLKGKVAGKSVDKVMEKLFEGRCLRRTPKTVLLRRDGVECIFNYRSGVTFELVRTGAIRRARPYYMRNLGAKQLRIPERLKRPQINKPAQQAK